MEKIERGDMTRIIKARKEKLKLIHRLQIESFTPLLEEYQDYETNPANESLEDIVIKYNQDNTTYYLIEHEDKTVGAFRIVTLENNSYRISPIFILPSEQGKGIGQKVFHFIESHYKDAKKFCLETILQDERNCCFYQKIGYQKTGSYKEVKEGMTIVYYEKKML